MKKNLINLLVLFVTSLVFSQVPPELISYRAIALNAAGNIISNDDIGIRISILDATFNPIFVETHIKHTDANGAYNLNIGGGSFISGTVFSNINWGGGNRHLKIEIDPNGGINYTINVGITQLLSVPYALLAKNVVNNNSIEITNTINDLLTNVVPVNNKIVYVKGYYTEGDGGEGMFIFNSASNLSNNLGTIFKSNLSSTGRWIRQYSGYINVSYFGVKRDWLPSGFSNSDRIQNAIDYSTIVSTYNNLSSDKTIFFPNGEYFIDKPLILKDRIKIIGGSSTMFTVWQGSTYDYMIKMDVGVLNGIELSKIHFNLNHTPNIGGIYLKANGVSNNDGGVWCSTFKDIKMGNLKGNGIFLEGGDVTTYKLPNQFLIFENVRITREDDNYNSLKMTGEQGQITFLNCTFDGTTNRGPNVYIGKLNPNDVGGSGNAVISFINSTVQDSEYGALIDSSQNITFDNCWFERLDNGLEIRNSNGINIFNNRFVDAAGHGSISPSLVLPGQGRCISSENSFVNINNNFVSVTDPSSQNAQNEFFILGIGNNNVLNVNNNSFQDPRQSATFGIMQTTLISSNKINIGSKKLVFVNSSGTVNRIDSTVNAGETLFIRANGGNITFLPMNPTNETTGKNIFLNGRSSLVLTNGQAATFIKIDNVVGNEKASYQLVSISN